MPRSHLIARVAGAVVILLVVVAGLLASLDTSGSPAAERADRSSMPAGDEPGGDPSRAGPTDESTPRDGSIPPGDRGADGHPDPAGATGDDDGASGATPRGAEAGPEVEADPALLAACGERRREAREEAFAGGMGLGRGAELLEAYREAGCVDVCGQMHAPPSDARCVPG